MTNLQLNLILEALQFQTTNLQCNLILQAIQRQTYALLSQARGLETNAQLHASSIENLLLKLNPDEESERQKHFDAIL